MAVTAADLMVNYAAAVEFEHAARRLLEWSDQQKEYIKKVLALVPVAATQVTFHVHDAVTKALTTEADWRWELWWRFEELVVTMRTTTESCVRYGRRTWPDCKVRVTLHGKDVSALLASVWHNLVNDRAVQGSVPLPDADVLAAELSRMLLPPDK
jgi:hypothetical protein